MAFQFFAFSRACVPATVSAPNARSLVLPALSLLLLFVVFFEFAFAFRFALRLFGCYCTGTGQVAVVGCVCWRSCVLAHYSSNFRRADGNVLWISSLIISRCA